MEFDDIIPALSGVKSREQISSEDFQKMLFRYFEEKGLVANLRSHLRVQMINELRNTSIGKLEYPKNSSLSQQAFNLVIAEHLLREGCHYTLSVFSTEAPPVANQLPISTLEVSKFKENEKWRFDEESVENVLELIGISKRSEENIRIRTVYTQDNKSLLSCIISSKFTKGSPNEILLENTDNESDFFGYFSRVMTILGAPVRVIHELQTKIQQYLRNENDNLCLKTQKEIDDFKSLLSAKDGEIFQLTQERLAIRTDLKMLKNERRNFKKRIDEITQKEEQIQNREGVLQGRIIEIDKLENDLKFCLEKNCLECAKKHCTDTCENNLKTVEKQHKEIVELQEFNQEKLLEIEKLQAKITMLSNDLRNSQLKIDFLNCCLEKSSEINLVLPQIKEIESSESSENLTEEVLLQARTRLQKLGKESDDLDVKFKQFKMNK